MYSDSFCSDILLNSFCFPSGIVRSSPGYVAGIIGYDILRRSVVELPPRANLPPLLFRPKGPHGNDSVVKSNYTVVFHNTTTYPEEGLKDVQWQDLCMVQWASASEIGCDQHLVAAVALFSSLTCGNFAAQWDLWPWILVGCIMLNNWSERWILWWIPWYAFTCWRTMFTIEFCSVSPCDVNAGCRFCGDLLLWEYCAAIAICHKIWKWPIVHPKTLWQCLCLVIDVGSVLEHICSLPVILKVM